MNARNLVLLVAGASLTAGIAACDDNAAPVAAGTTKPTATTPATATGTPAASASPAGGTTASACPVTEADLRKAVMRQAGKGAAKEPKLTDIVCYQGYAIATRPSGVADDENAVFKHDSGSWTMISSNTSDDICDNVPADVVKHFSEAHYGACH